MKARRRRQRHCPEMAWKPLFTTLSMSTATEFWIWPDTDIGGLAASVMSEL